MLPTRKQTYLLLMFIPLCLLGYALYTEYFEYLDPCPLCMTQRLFYVLVSLFALLALLHSRAHKVYAVLGTLSAMGGAAVATRQVWLQHLPKDRVPACGPSLEYMLQTFPMGDVLKALVHGDGNCAEAIWHFLGLSMAEWSLICFVGLIAACFWQLLRRDA